MKTVDYLIWIIVITLPFQLALNLGNGVDLLFVRVLIPIVFVFWLLRGLGGKNITIPFSVVTALVALFIFLTALSLFFAIKPELGTRKMVYYVSILPLFFVAADIFREDKARKTGLKLVIISGFLGSLVGIFQFISQFIFGLEPTLNFLRKAAPHFLGQSFGELVMQNSSWLVNISGHTVLRAFGFFSDPHVYSFFETLTFFVALGYFIGAKKRKEKIFCGAALICMASAIAFSFSRGAYMGMLIGMMFFVVLLLFKKGWLAKGLLIASIFLVVLFAVSRTTILARLSSSFNLREGSNAERIKNWEQAYEVITYYPLIGVGLGNYASVVNSEAKERSSIYAHNTYLDIASETGIANALLFTLMILSMVKRQIQFGSSVNLGIAAALVYFLAHSVFDTPLFSPQVLSMLLVILALGLYTFKGVEQKRTA
ncbi:MAG: O-antigen ligase family protein [Parcubacteria group bacterium]|jgi:O-antigen ligase